MRHYNALINRIFIIADNVSYKFMTFLKLLVEPTSEALVPLVTSSSADLQYWKRDL